MADCSAHSAEINSMNSLYLFFLSFFLFLKSSPGENSFQETSGDMQNNACMLSLFSCVQFFVTLWTVVHQAPLSMDFSRQEYWSGLPFPSPGDLPNSEIEPRSPALQADALPSELLEKPQRGRKGRDKLGIWG